MRKDNLGAVYRRLTKKLHPDLEPDEAERERKVRLVQDITATYSRGDLHALLQFELQWLESAGSDAACLSVKRLRACPGLLKQQAKELEAELQWLQFHPRYPALLVGGPFGLPCLIDWPGKAERLDAIIESLDAAVQRLSSSEGAPGSTRGHSRVPRCGARVRSTAR